MRSGVLTSNDTGGAAQVAAAHCPNERTLDPAGCSQTDPTMPQQAALWPSPHYQICDPLHADIGNASLG